MGAIDEEARKLDELIERALRAQGVRRRRLRRAVQDHVDRLAKLLAAIASAG